MDKDIEHAMEEAQHLDNEEIPTDREIAEQYEDDMKKAEQARKLLKPAREPVSRRKKSPSRAK
jgi:hypothetical protein